MLDNLIRFVRLLNLGLAGGRKNLIHIQSLSRHSVDAIYRTNVSHIQFDLQRDIICKHDKEGPGSTESLLSMLKLLYNPDFPKWLGCTQGRRIVWMDLAAIHYQNVDAPSSPALSKPRIAFYTNS